MMDAIHSGSDNFNQPIRGTNSHNVFLKFGSPYQELKPIGNPPISRWVYDHFTVYFENDKVISSVRNQ